MPKSFLPTLILKVAVPSPFRHVLDYLPPSNQIHEMQPGCRLWVPLRNRKTLGILISTSNTPEVSVDKLKPAYAWIDETPILPPSLMQLGLWASHYYQHPIGEVFQHLLPPALRQGQAPTPQTTPGIWQLTLKGQLLEETLVLKQAPKQQQAIRLLREHEQGLSLSALKILNVPSSILKILQQKGWIETRPLPVKRQEPATTNVMEAALALNAEQQKALTHLMQQPNTFRCSLLDGITGSGKTEIYLQWITYWLSQQKQVLVLVPEIGLTPQTLARFKRRFNANILVLHSKLTDKERWLAWNAAYTGSAHIIIGTRSAVFIPLAHPGAIIVDEEQDASFKQQSGFRYSARDLAVYRAKLENIPILLGSATPSLESLNNCAQGRYHPLLLTQRAGQAKLPQFNIVDIRDKTLIEGFSPIVLEAIQRTLDQGEQALIFLNRRGYAPSLICHHCGWVVQCPHCDAHLTLYSRPARLLCHHCGYGQTAPQFCAHCQSSDLRSLGAGTERLEETLTHYFPKTPVIRIDKDSTRGKLSFAQLLDQIHQQKPLILVGTQMLAKGHHFPLVTLVLLLDMDAGLYTGDFRGPERTAQLILQVAGRAGREERPGTVWLQTRTPNHPLLISIQQHDYGHFAQQELIQRQAAHLPPFFPMALIRAESRKPTDAQQLLSKAAKYAQIQPLTQTHVLGPVPAMMEKKANFYRAQLLLTASHSKELRQLLHRTIHFIDQQPETKKVRWSAEMDPLELY